MKIDFGMLRTVYINEGTLWVYKSQVFFGGQCHRIFLLDEIKRK